jgi:hypothetical protein
VHHDDESACQTQGVENFCKLHADKTKRRRREREKIKAFNMLTTMTQRTQQ